MTKNKVIERIKKLLALSGSPNPAEAESALRFAHELMDKYRISSSDVERGQIMIDDSDAERERRCIRTWDNQLIAVIAHRNFCFAYRGRNWHGGTLIRLVGRPVNVDVTWLMYEYVRKCALTEARKITAKKRSKFLRGFVLGIVAQLEEKDSHWGIEERRAVHEYVGKHVGELQTVNIKPARSSQSMLRGFTSGSSVNLTRQVSTESKPVIAGVLT